MTAPITIGNSVLPNAVINAGVLRSQITVNSSNPLSSPGNWAGSATIAGQVLSPLPTYSQPSLVLTGNNTLDGAIGLFPYRLYRNDSVPSPLANGDPGTQSISQFVAGSPAADVVVRHYGPVFLASGQTVPLNIERFDGTAWVPANSLFSQFVSGRGVTLRRAAALSTEDLTLLVTVATYRVYPAGLDGTALVCQPILLVATNPPPAPVPVVDYISSPFVFRLTCASGGQPSPADIVGGDGNPPRDFSVDGNDFVAFLNAFSAGSLLADIVGGEGNPPADGSIDGNDFQAFLNSFAAGGGC